MELLNSQKLLVKRVTPEPAHHDDGKSRTVQAVIRRRACEDLSAVVIEALGDGLYT